jgi:hypothetical protein
VKLTDIEPMTVRWCPPEAEQLFLDLQARAVADVREAAGLDHPELGKTAKAIDVRRSPSREIAMARAAHSLQIEWGRILADLYARHTIPVMPVIRMADLDPHTPHVGPSVRGDERPAGMEGLQDNDDRLSE